MRIQGPCSPKQQSHALRHHLGTKTQTACPPLTDTAWPPAFPGAAEKDKISPCCIWQTDSALHFICLCSKALLATQSSATAHSRGEATRELQKLRRCLTLTSSPVAVSTAVHTVPKPLETKQQRRKKKSFSPCKDKTLQSNGKKFLGKK